MLLFLSSAAMPRYKQDIIRALAMPVGATLQFRYKTKWIDHSLLDLVKSMQLNGRQACIAYIDQSQPGTLPEIAPVRAATVRAAEVQGDFSVVELELAGFAFVRDIKAFNKQLRAQSANLPHWDSESESPHPVGNYCEQIETKKLPLKLDADAGEWQATCKGLAGYADFQSQDFFYRLEEVRNVRKREAIRCDGSALKLRSGDLYDVHLLHYSPGTLHFPNPVTNVDLSWLIADADDKAFTFVSTKSMAVDSKYDLKTVRIRTATTTVPIDARISFSRRPPGAAKPDEAMWDFDLQARITPRWGTLIGQGIVVGVSLAAQGLILTFNSKAIDDKDKLVVALWVVVAGLVGGFLTSFGLRK